MNQHPRRVRSPPQFDYDPRAMNIRPEYDGRYHHANQFDGPPMPPLPPSGLFQPYLGHSNEFEGNFRDNHGLPSTYRATINSREQHPMGMLTNSPPPPPRAGSPPYKILCITNINPKIDDGSIKEALRSEYTRFGDVSVSICHDSGERLAYIYFQNYEEAREARIMKSRTLFFDRPIDIEPIYEPHLNGSPIETSSPPLPPAMGQPMPPVYASRRRSITPPPSQYPLYPSPPVHRKYLPPESTSFTVAQQSTHHPSYHHRGMSPHEYIQPQPSSAHMSAYPYAHSSSPPPMQPMGPATVPRDRRNNHPGYGPPAGIASPHATYSSPPREAYRPSAYPPRQPYNHHQIEPQLPVYIEDGPPNQPQYSGPRRSERDRIPSDGIRTSHRSPRSPPPYYPQHRGYPQPPYHHSSSRPPPAVGHNHHHSSIPSNYQSRATNREHRASQNHRGYHPAPDPPARYLSREFRREKFGADYGNGDIEDGRPSRVLLVNNIDPTKTELDLREVFGAFGIVEEMEVKEVGPGISSALIKFSSMDGAYKAKTANDGRHMGNLRCRIVYGKVSASRRLWIGGLSPTTTVISLEDECSKYGELTSVDYFSGRPYAYVEYESSNQAQFAAHHLKTTLTPASERKIRIEFVDPDRIEKLVASNDSGSQNSEVGSKSRTTNESWPTSELEPSPRSSGSRKRSMTPIESSTASNKKPCLAGDPSGMSNTFKQERIAAAVAARARNSSTTSSIVSQHQSSINEDTEKNVETNYENSELNNNNNGNELETTNIAEQQRSAIKNDPAETPSLDGLMECTSMHDIIRQCSTSWCSQITLRNFIFPARMFLCSGQKETIDRFFMRLSDIKENGGATYCCPTLKITQRWRLHPQPKLEEVKRRMQSGNLGFLIIAGRSDEPELATSSSAMISEKSQKQTCEEHNVEEGNTNTSNHESTNRKQNHNINEVRSNQMSLKPTSPSSQAETKLNSNRVEENSIGKSNNDSDSVPNVSGNDNATGQTTGQSRPLRNLISYLEQKDAAGVISLGSLEGAGADNQTPAGPNDDGNTKLLYAFPPGDFAFNLIKRMSPNLTSDAIRGEFLIGVIIGSN